MRWWVSRAWRCSGVVVQMEKVGSTLFLFLFPSVTVAVAGVDSGNLLPVDHIHPDAKLSRPCCETAFGGVSSKKYRGFLKEKWVWLPQIVQRRVPPVFSVEAGFPSCFRHLVVDRRWSNKCRVDGKACCSEKQVALALVLPTGDGSCSGMKVLSSVLSGGSDPRVASVCSFEESFSVFWMPELSNDCSLPTKLGAISYYLASTFENCFEIAQVGVIEVGLMTSGKQSCQDRVLSADIGSESVKESSGSSNVDLAISFDLDVSLGSDEGCCSMRQVGCEDGTFHDVTRSGRGRQVVVENDGGLTMVLSEAGELVCSVSPWADGFIKAAASIFAEPTQPTPT